MWYHIRVLPSMDGLPLTYTREVKSVPHTYEVWWDEVDLHHLVAAGLLAERGWAARAGDGWAWCYEYSLTLDGPRQPGEYFDGFGKPIHRGEYNMYETLREDSYNDGPEPDITTPWGEKV